MGRITVLSTAEEVFKDRVEAGRLLGSALKGFGGDNTVVLGIPRGGLVVAKEAAGILKASLDIVLSRKIGAPRNPELAIGAIGETGKAIIDDVLASSTGADADYIKKESEHQASEIRRRAKIFRDALPKSDLKGKTVIITDDGLATGATMQVSLSSIRGEEPARLIAAVPVASGEAVEKIVPYCDEAIVLEVPDFFGAVGQFYDRFEQTTDEEVVEILKKEFARRKAGR